MLAAQSSLPELLRLIKKRTRLTQAEIGRLAGVDRGTINRWANGAQKPQGLAPVLRQLADSLREEFPEHSALADEVDRFVAADTAARVERQHPHLAVVETIRGPLSEAEQEAAARAVADLRASAEEIPPELMAALSDDSRGEIRHATFMYRGELRTVTLSADATAARAAETWRGLQQHWAEEGGDPLPAPKPQQQDQQKAAVVHKLPNRKRA